MELEGIRTAGQAARPGIDTATGNQAVDKEAFLKLLVAQLQQQDPLSPVDGTEWVAQLAQFSVVEQQMQQSEQLDLISLQLTGIASNEAIGLIGKEVTVQGDMISFDGVEATGFSVDLQKPAAEVTVTIRDAQGNAVKTMELGAQKAGPLPVTWDGTDENGDTVPPGSYSVEVSARDADGNPVTVSQDVTGTVVGVTFDKGYPEVILDSGVTAPISDLISVAGGKSNDPTDPFTLTRSNP
ncbi:MAG: FlgD immunoglobulin-like domain containing protein [Polyangiaceae bacterium]